METNSNKENVAPRVRSGHPGFPLTASTPKNQYNSASAFPFRLATPVRPPFSKDVSASQQPEAHSKTDGLSVFRSCFPTNSTQNGITSNDFFASPCPVPTSPWVGRPPLRNLNSSGDSGYLSGASIIIPPFNVTPQPPSFEEGQSNEEQPLDLCFNGPNRSTSTSCTTSNVSRIPPALPYLGIFLSKQLTFQTPVAKQCYAAETQQSEPTKPAKTHKCSYFEKTFSRRWLLKGHERVHTGEKPFPCPTCHRAFADASNLRAHKETHKDVKKFECKFCPKSFGRRSLLIKHMEKHYS